MKTVRKPTSESIALTRTPIDWAIAITTNIADSHLQGWAASIIAWDTDKDAYWTGLGVLMNQYDAERINEYRTSDIVAALDAIGYPASLERCVIRQDEEREKVNRRVGLKGAPDSKYFHRSAHSYIIAVA
jgi:hypothetical protein